MERTVVLLLRAEELLDAAASATELRQGNETMLPLAEFKSFLDRAKPLAVASVEKLLPELALRASLMSRWMTDHDLLEVAGLAYAENPYIELLAWSLRRDTHPPSALARQRTWLGALGLNPSPTVERAVVPVTQYVTKDGRPDLLLHYPDGVVVIEVKTGTEEHETPSGLSQTHAYGTSVAKSLRLPDGVPVHVVFLTPGREAPMNPAATRASFIEFVLALAAALERYEMPPETAAAYRMLFTHLLSSASPVGADAMSLVKSIVEWSSEPSWAEPDAVARRLTDLTRACRLLLPGEWHD